MNMNFFMMETMMRERQKALLDEAERWRMAARAGRRDGPRRVRTRRVLAAPLLVGLGKTLVLLGNRLQSRYCPAVTATAALPCQPAQPSP